MLRAKLCGSRAELLAPVWEAVFFLLLSHNSEFSVTVLNIKVDATMCVIHGTEALLFISGFLPCCPQSEMANHHVI